MQLRLKMPTLPWRGIVIANAEYPMKVHYSSDGEYPFTGDLQELMGNFRESGMDESIIDEIVRCVEKIGRYEGTHEFGHFTITTKASGS